MSKFILLNCPYNINFARFREGYGMTEMSPAVTFTDMNTNDTGGSCGKLLPNTSMKVVDLDTGAELGPGHRGELCFAGPQVMEGYFNNEKATTETLINGWIHTGDIGYYDKASVHQLSMSIVKSQYSVNVAQHYYKL